MNTELCTTSEYLHNVPSTSNTMPFNSGLVSPSFFFAGSSGANRRGRTGCDMLFTDRVARKQIRMLLVPDGLQRPLSWLECRDMMAFMLVGLYKPVLFWKWVRLQPHLGSLCAWPPVLVWRG